MIRTLLAFVSIILCLNVPIQAQEQLNHEKKIYVSPENKIFFNKSLPVHFYIASSTDPNARHYLLTSETMPQYSNPMYFDTEGKNTLRSPSAVDTATKKPVMPLTDVRFEVYVDSKPPSTTILFEKTNSHSARNTFYTKGPLSVSFKSVDELAGVENTYVSTDGKEFIPCNSTLTLDNEKEYLIKYYSVDNTGNAEQLNEIKFSLDNTPPTTKINISGEKFENILSGNSQISLAASDSGSGLKQIYISLDDSVFYPYKKLHTATMKQGEHKLFFYSTDNVSNKEQVNSYSFYVDKTPPQVIEEVMGKTFIANGREYSAGTSKLKITSFDNKAGVKEVYYSINKAPYIKYEKPILLSGYKGNMLINSYAVDNVGNKSLNDLSNTRKNNIPYIDLSAPWVGYFYKGANFIDRDTVFINSKTRIVLEARDSESGINHIEYQKDSSDLIRYTEPFTLNKEGYHSISVYGYDNTDNLTRQQFGVVVDTIGPHIFVRFSTLSVGTINENGEKTDEYPGHTVVFISATDEKSGFQRMQYTLNNSPATTYTGFIRGFMPGKKNKIKIKAFDKLGNQTEKMIEFYLR